MSGLPKDFDGGVLIMSEQETYGEDHARLRQNVIHELGELMAEMCKMSGVPKREAGAAIGVGEESLDWWDDEVPVRPGFLIRPWQAASFARATTQMGVMSMRRIVEDIWAGRYESARDRMAKYYRAMQTDYEAKKEAERNEGR